MPITQGKGRGGRPGLHRKIGTAGVLPLSLSNRGRRVAATSDKFSVTETGSPSLPDGVAAIACVMLVSATAWRRENTFHVANTTSVAWTEINDQRAACENDDIATFPAILVARIRRKQSSTESLLAA